MTDNNDDLAFTEKVDPYQARNGRREALQFALALATKNESSANARTLIEYASQIDSYLEDGSSPATEDQDRSRAVHGVRSIHR